MKWFKFYGQDFLTDSKLGSLNPYQRLMWVTLLCVASQDDEKTGILKFMKESRIVALSGLDYEDMDSMYGIRQDDTFRIFEELGLISFTDKNTLLIVNYKKKQTENMTVAERVSAYRDRKKGLEKPDVTQSNEPTLQSNKNVTLEKRRVEESREEKKEEKREKPENSLAFLENLPEEFIQTLLEKYNTTPKGIKDLGETLANYCRSKGRKYSNYKAFYLNAAKKEFKEKNDEDRERQRRIEESKMAGPSPFTQSLLSKMKM